MKNLKSERLGLAYTNSQGHRCVITAYKSNKEMVVHDEVTDKYLHCRWCDLHNPKCKAVYNPMLGKVKEIVAETPDLKPTGNPASDFVKVYGEGETPEPPATNTTASTLPNEELVNEEEKEGLSAALFVIGVGIIIVGVLLWALL